MGNTKAGYYAVIPANVRYADITPNAKLLYGEISALTNKEGFCWAGNRYFAELYKVDTRTVKRWLSELIKIGAIIVSGSTTKRHISLGTILSQVGDKKVPSIRDNFVIKNTTRENNTSNRDIATVKTVAGNGSVLDNFIGKKKEQEKETNKEIPEIIELFKPVNPVAYSKWFANKTQRGAVVRLLKAFPRPGLDKIIGYLPQINQVKYAPHAHTPLELEDKVAAIRDFVQSQRNTGKGKEIIGL